MRKIKCRVWDKENNKFFEPTYEAYAGKLEDLFISLGGDLLMRDMNGISHESIFPNRFIIQQYTGLLDKDGKKIFEGDIVRTWANPKDYGGYKGHDYTEIVEWDNDFHGFILSEGHGLTDFSYIEVLGNIYENENLLLCR